MQNKMADFNFELLSVALLKASFERPLELALGSGQVKTITKINVTARVSDNEGGNIEVELTVSVDIPTIAGKQSMQVSATMLGVFLPHGNPPKEVSDSFSNVNGPAILYPFVREAIANLTIKGNVAPVLLPTMNFAAAFASVQQQTAQQLAAASPKKIAEPKKSKSKTTPKK